MTSPTQPKTKKIKAERKYVVSSYAKLLNDLPEGVTPSIQTIYLNEVMGLFMRTLVKVYSPGELSDKDRANLKRYFEKVLEAKDALDGKTTGGRVL